MLTYFGTSKQYFKAPWGCLLKDDFGLVALVTVAEFVCVASLVHLGRGLLNESRPQADLLGGGRWPEHLFVCTCKCAWEEAITASSSYE